MFRRNFVKGVGGAAAVGSVAALAGSAGADVAAQESSSADGPRELDLLGSVAISNTCEAVVDDDGETVYVATKDGFATVDVSTPEQPTVLATVTGVLGDRQAGPIQELRDVDLDGDRLLAAGPAHATRGSKGAVAYDVSDPSAPEQVSAHETDYPIHNCHVADGVGYLTGNGAEGNPLVTIDVETGEELGRWSLFDVDDAWRDVSSKLRMIHDVSVRDGLAYVAHWDAGTWILDVSDPTDPVVVSRVRGRSPETLASIYDTDDEYIALPGNDHSAVTDETGTLLGVCEEAWSADDPNAGAEAHGGLLLYDVSDTANPELLSRIDPPPTSDPTRGGNPTTAHNFEFVDGLCYSSWYQGGVKIHDVSDPSEPVELAYWRDDDRATIWTAQAGVRGEFFVASIREDPGSYDGGTGILTFPDVGAGDGGEPTATPTESVGATTPTPTEDAGGPSPTPTGDAGEPTATPTEDAWEPTATRTDNSGEPTATPTGDPGGPTATPTGEAEEPTASPTEDAGEQSDSETTPTPTESGENLNASAPGTDEESGGLPPDVSIGTGDVFAVPGVGALVAAGAVGLGALRRFRRSE